MLTTELAKKLQLEPVCQGETDKEVTGCYIGDMLSVVMSRAEEGDIWLTVQANVNIAAVAVLTGVSAIVLVEGMTPDPDTIEKAKAQDITIYRWDDTAYALASKIKELL